MNKESEKKRLASIVFDGAPDWAVCAVLSHKRKWFILSDTPFINAHRWEPSLKSVVDVCKNQPKTKLPWTETLICRSDYA